MGFFHETFLTTIEEQHSLFLNCIILLKQADWYNWIFLPLAVLATKGMAGFVAWASMIGVAELMSVVTIPVTRIVVWAVAVIVVVVWAIAVIVVVSAPIGNAGGISEQAGSAVARICVTKFNKLRAANI